MMRSSEERDYDANLAWAVHKLNTAFAAQTSGMWEPNSMNRVLLHYFAHILGEREMPDGDWNELLTQKPVRPRGRAAGYDDYLSSAINTISVCLCAFENGRWTPNARSEALLFSASLTVSIYLNNNRTVI